MSEEEGLFNKLIKRGLSEVKEKVMRDFKNQNEKQTQEVRDVKANVESKVVQIMPDALKKIKEKDNIRMKMISDQTKDK